MDVIFPQMDNVADRATAGKATGENALLPAGVSYPMAMLIIAITIAVR